MHRDDVSPTAVRVRAILLGLLFVAGGFALSTAFAPSAAADDGDGALETLLGAVDSVASGVEEPLVHTVEHVVVTVDRTTAAADTVVARALPAPAAASAPASATPARDANRALSISAVSRPLTAAVGDIAAARPLSTVTATVGSVTHTVVAEIPVLESLLEVPLGQDALAPASGTGGPDHAGAVAAMQPSAALPFASRGNAAAAESPVVSAPSASDTPGTAAPLQPAPAGDPAPASPQSTPPAGGGASYSPLAVASDSILHTPALTALGTRASDDTVPASATYDTDASPD